jgi:nucleotide-binding universal stress UspA family protein
MIHTILVALDGSTLAERALPLGCALANTFDARLVLVRVAHEGAGRTADAGDKAAEDEARRADEADRVAIDEARANVREEDHILSVDARSVERAQGQIRGIAEAEGYLAEVAERLAGEGITAETAVPFGAPVDGILTEIELRSADVVVMCTHGKTGLLQLLLGSVTQGVLARSRVPVLVVPPPDRS